MNDVHRIWEDPLIGQYVKKKPKEIVFPLKVGESPQKNKGQPKTHAILTCKHRHGDQPGIVVSGVSPFTLSHSSTVTSLAICFAGGTKKIRFISSTPKSSEGHQFRGITLNSKTVE